MIWNAPFKTKVLGKSKEINIVYLFWKKSTNFYNGVFVEEFENVKDKRKRNIKKEKG